MRRIAAGAVVLGLLVGCDAAGPSSDDTDVDASDCDVAADGSAAFTSVQAAVDAANSGVLVKVCAGTYGPVVVDGIDVRIAGTGEVVLQSTEGPALTLLGGDLELEGFTLTGAAAADGATAGLLVEGGTLNATRLRIANCTVDSGGYVVSSASARLTFEDLVVASNVVEGWVFQATDGQLDLKHASFLDNDSTGNGAGLLNFLRVAGDFTNSVVAHNDVGRYAPAITIRADGSDLTVANVVFHDNDNDQGYPVIELDRFVTFHNNIISDNIGGGLVMRDDSDGENVGWNLAWNNLGDNDTFPPGLVGEGNLVGDPKLVNPSGGDYHLEPGSPGIDAGNPASDHNDVDGTRNDLGAFGGPAGVWP